jgi:ferric-dicitrate binding protein FerR (iron transport regulator)
VFDYGHDQWAVRLPSGTYRAVGAAGCPEPERPFVVTAGKTVMGVIVSFGCDHI